MLNCLTAVVGLCLGFYRFFFTKADDPGNAYKFTLDGILKDLGWMRREASLTTTAVYVGGVLFLGLAAAALMATGTMLALLSYVLVFFQFVIALSGAVTGVMSAFKEQRGPGRAIAAVALGLACLAIFLGTMRLLRFV